MGKIAKAKQSKNPEKIQRLFIALKMDWRKSLLGGGSTDTRSFMLQTIVDVFDQPDSMGAAKAALGQAVESGAKAFNGDSNSTEAKPLKKRLPSSAEEEFHHVSQCDVGLLWMVAWRAGHCEHEELTAEQLMESAKIMESKILEGLSAIGEVKWISWAPERCRSEEGMALTDLDFEKVKEWAHGIKFYFKSHWDVDFPTEKMPVMAAMRERLEISEAARSIFDTYSPAPRL